MHIKKQNAQIRQLETAAQQAEEKTRQAEQQYTKHVQRLQSQMGDAQHHTVSATDTTHMSTGSESDSALQAELQKLTRQLAEAHEQISHMQQQQQQAEQSSANSSHDLPSNPTTPSKPDPNSTTQDLAAPGSSIAASADKDSVKDKDAQLQEYKQRLVKAKKYIQNLKQQAADANAAKEQAVTNLQAAQEQLEKQKSDEAVESMGHHAGEDTVPQAQFEQVQVSSIRRLACYYGVGIQEKC